MALLGASVLVAGAGGGVGSLVGTAIEEVIRVWAGAELRADGVADVVEVIDYDFGLQQKHGIFRVVPGLDPDAPIDVSSPDAPDDVFVEDTFEGVRLRIGDPAKTITGRHRYRIAYPLPGVAPGGEVAWNAVGTAWEVEVKAAEIHLVADQEFVDPRCVQGGVGSVDRCDVAQPEPGHLVATAESLSSGEGVTVYAGLGDRLGAAPALPDPGPSPDDDRPSPAVPMAAGGLAALLSVAPASWLIRRAGRERVWPGGAADAAFGPGGSRPPTAGMEPLRIDAEELAAMATTDFAPPEDLHPAQGGIVLREQVRAEHRVAWLIETAAAGYVDLDGQSPLRIVRRPSPASADPGVVAILDEAFDGRDEIELGSYDPSFAKAWGDVLTVLERWRATSDLWDPAGTSRQTTARVLGVLLGVVGLVGVFATALLATRESTGWLFATAGCGVLFGAACAAVVRGWELKVRTPRGTGLWLRVESFRRFLAESEAYHAEEAAKRGVLREYTAWAVAVGEIDRWSRSVAGATIPPTEASAVHFAMMAPALSSATSSTSTAPSSSGSGSGGGFSGGGVGGGAGGGGGGSW